MGHQIYVLLCTETTLSNPPVVQLKSSCDVHLLRSPCLNWPSASFRVKIVQKKECRHDVGFKLYSIITTYILHFFMLNVHWSFVDIYRQRVKTRMKNTFVMRQLPPMRKCSNMLGLDICRSITFLVGLRLKKTGLRGAAFKVII